MKIFFQVQIYLKVKFKKKKYLKIISNNSKYQNKKEITPELEHILFKKMKLKSNNKYQKRMKIKKNEILEKLINEINEKY